MTTALFTKQIHEAVRRHLSALGFRKRTGGIFTIEVADGVLGWLGLNAAYRRLEDQMEVNPMVGIRHQEVERLAAEIGDHWRFHPYAPPTVSISLGYLTPAARYTPWLFDRDGPFDEVAADLATAVRYYALPFMRENASLERLLELIRRGQGVPEQLAYSRPVALLLSGGRDAALKALEEEVGKLGDRADPAAQLFRSFAERFRTRLAAVN